MRLLLLLIGVVAVVNARDSYVIVVPKDVRPGVPLSISVNILHATADVNVKADLVLKSTAAKITTTQKSFQQGVPGTLSLQVPVDLASGTYKVTVEGTNGLSFSNETDLHYQSKSMSVFIQTDKAMYKPGQTVHYRAFAMYPDLKVYTGPMDIEIYDPNSNKIKQLLNVKDSSGVVTNFLNVDSQPVLGDWKIKVTANGKSTQKEITIAHYVLPKFEVTVELPPFGLTNTDNVQGTVKAMYTYGKPVEGTVTLQTKLENWYRPWNYHDEEPMVKQTLQINGDAKFTIPLATLKAAQHYMNGHSIVVEANVTETLTHMTLSGSSKLKFYDHAEKIEFLSSNPNTFKPGLAYTAYVRVSEQDDRPITGAKQALNLQTTVTFEYPETGTTPVYYWGPRTGNYKLNDHSFTVPDTGVVPVQVIIPDNATNINLHATYGPVSAYKSLQKSYSPSDSYIQLFLKSSSIRAGNVANFDVKSTQPVAKAVYQVMSRGAIVKTGTVDGGNAKTFTFGIPVNSKMAPNARIVIYYVRTDGEIVTDSISFDVEGVFQNQVSISFDKTKAQPGDGVNVEVTADPQSHVNLLAVDQSVLLLKSGNDITPDEIVDELKSYDTISHSNIDYPIAFGGGMIINRKKRMIWWPYATYYGGSDAQQIFDNAGVKVMTDATVYHHVSRHPVYPYFMEPLPGMTMPPMAPGGVMPMPQIPPVNSVDLTSNLQNVDKIRTVFPETWLWMNETTGYRLINYAFCLLLIVR